MRAHYRPHFVQKTVSLRRFFQRGRTHSLFCGDRSRRRAQKNRRSLRHFKTTRHFRPILHTLIMAPYPAAVCNFCHSGSFFHLLLHTITAAAHHRGGTSRDRALIATHPVCFDRLTPQAATTSYVIGSAIRAKKQLFHVKHRFLQCFSLEFYLLFALSLLPHCLMFHLFRYWFNRHAAVCFVDR